MDVRYFPKKIDGSRDGNSRVLHRFHDAEINEEEEKGTFSVLFVLQALYRNLLLGLILIPLGAALFFGISKVIVPVYKSPAVISIQSSYFRGPLVSDLIPEEHDHGELLAMRSSLVQLAISDDFILSLFDRFPGLRDELGVDTGVLELDERVRSLAITRFREHMEFFSLGGNSYHISSMLSSQALAQRVSQALLDQVISQLAIERKNLLQSAREAISNHVRKLAAELSAIEQSLRVSDEKTLSDELSRARADLNSLLTLYTERHPKVAQLQRETASLEKRLRTLQESSLKIDEENMPRSEAAKIPTQDVYNELLKKLSFIQISLSMEEEDVSRHLRVIQQPLFPLIPFFPNPLLFLSLGAIFGFILWIILTTIREISSHSKIVSSVEALALTNEILYLGKFPESENSFDIQLHPGQGDQSPGVVLPHKRIVLSGE